MWKTGNPKTLKYEITHTHTHKCTSYQTNQCELRIISIPGDERSPQDAASDLSWGFERYLRGGLARSAAPSHAASAGPDVERRADRGQGAWFRHRQEHADGEQLSGSAQGNTAKP